MKRHLFLLLPLSLPAVPYGRKASAAEAIEDFRDWASIHCR
jgi:hypothetical protein